MILVGRLCFDGCFFFSVEVFVLVVVADSEEALSFEIEVGGKTCEVIHDVLEQAFTVDLVSTFELSEVVLIGAEDAWKDTGGSG